MAGEEHLRLSQYIKNVHEDLRFSSRNLGWKQAWVEHCNRKEVLEEYASAMHELATKFWESKEESNINSRIEWVAKQCQWYFFDGGLQDINDQDLVKICRIDSIPKEQSSYISDAYLDLSFNNPLFLLDVGSCYNPLKTFSMFKTIAIDLAPATSDVFKCDFLELCVGGSDKDSDFDSVRRKLACPLNLSELPCEWFDVVNFSLFLEYLPSSLLRFECCKKAFELLKPGGLLFIISPDSKHASANAPLMKSWRIALGTLGFVRISYQKLTHLHCMAFRKCPYSILRTNLVERFERYAKIPPSDMIVIPQDLTVHTSEVASDSINCATDDSVDSVNVNFFPELPLSY
ncbi:S-adenosylmethionine sensor upstream of mTORC1 [Ischnura elegans]|uniref:S-adenosylmethionine sensor upstream of mTORC1 n=1 Tax=Ischnura elegans TaxID=197161 RepID=UPI001ED86730|nr:S-adenosylmethionine sensor upstream of mTORC1 [Ischnura elegans]